VIQLVCLMTVIIIYVNQIWYMIKNSGLKSGSNFSNATQTQKLIQEKILEWIVSENITCLNLKIWWRYLTKLPKLESEWNTEWKDSNLDSREAFNSTYNAELYNPKSPMSEITKTVLDWVTRCDLLFLLHLLSICGGVHSRLIVWL